MLADLLRIILAFFLPPLAVATQVGVQASAFWLNLIFWLFSFGGLGLPGRGGGLNGWFAS